MSFALPYYWSLAWAASAPHLNDYAAQLAMMVMLVSLVWRRLPAGKWPSGEEVLSIALAVSGFFAGGSLLRLAWDRPHNLTSEHGIWLAAAGYYMMLVSGKLAKDALAEQQPQPEPQPQPQLRRRRRRRRPR